MKNELLKIVTISLVFIFSCSLKVDAADQVVTNNNDSGAGSLRQAILDIESSGNDGDVITFNLSSGNETIILASALSTISQKDFDIDGDNEAGSGVDVTIQVTDPGVSAYRVFTIRPYSGTYTFSNMTLKGGSVGSGYGGVIKVYSGDTSGNLTLDNVTMSDGVSDYGGCIYAWGTMGKLTITNSIIQNCTSSSTSYGGGGLFVRSHQEALEISGSTFSNNTANGEGGAIHVYDETFNITDTTFYNNTSVGKGGGVYINGDDTLAVSNIENCTFDSNTVAGADSLSDMGGGIYYYYGNHKITNSTFFNNSAESGGAISYFYAPSIYLTNITVVGNTATNSSAAGGVYHGTSSTYLYMKNSLLANNTSVDFYGTPTNIVDGGYNLVETSTYATWTSTGNITGDQASLNISSSLADNGTLNGTQTLALLDGSVAINAGGSGSNGSVSIPTYDQRGLSRVSTVDIGAYEFGGSSNSTPIAGYSSDNVLGTATQSTDGSGYITIPFKIKDGDGDSCTTSSWQYSDDGGSSWNNLSADDLTGEDGDKTSATDWSGTEYSIVWHSKNQIDDTSQNDIRFRFIVNDGTADSSYATTANFSVDNLDPQSSSLTPIDNATSVAVNSNLTIVFGESVYAGSGNVLIKKTSDDSTVETISVSGVSGSGTNTITINPSSDFLSSTGYYIVIESDAFKDSQGNYFAGISVSSTWNFTSADIEAPIMSSLSPFGQQDSGTSSVVLSLSTNETATCKYSLSTSVFSSMTSFDNTFSTSHSSVVSGLEDSSSYIYYVVCRDSLDNESSSSISFSVAGGGISSISTPSAVGNGQNTSRISMGKTANVGSVNSGGLNILTYINSPAIFSSKNSGGNSSEYTMEIIDFDLFYNIMEIMISPISKKVILNLDDIGNLDLDGDGIDDVQIKFEDVYVNRAELTIISLLGEESLEKEDYENKLISYIGSPKVYLVQGGLKRWIVNSETFYQYGYDWKNVLYISENIQFSDGQNLDASSVYVFTRDLELGDTGEDVRQLQKILNSKGFIVSDYGVGSMGNETEYFGELTRQALIEFQQTNNISPAAGYFAHY